MQKPADTNFPIHQLIASRWSPRAFRAEAVSKEQLGALFEAARWSASCFNAQPWHYLAATSDDTDAYAKLASCLMDGNVPWATKAPVLAIAVARLDFAHNGKPNRWAPYDTGAASASLTLQAESMGLVVHQMGGFHADKVHGVPHLTETLVNYAKSTVKVVGGKHSADN